MALTGQPGTPNSLAGNLTPGYFPAPGTVTQRVQWVGPFDPSELHDTFDPYFEDFDPSTVMTTTQAATIALAAGDPSWWKVVP